MFQTLQPGAETMLAANGVPMTISGVRNSGPFDHVLFCPGLRINLLVTAGLAPELLHCIV